MPSFSKASEARLETCDERLARVARIVVARYDCSVIEGHRSDADQDVMFFTGKSKLRAGQSKHNVYPSMAVDLGPYYGDEDPRIPWDIDTFENRLRFTLFAGVVLGAAWAEGIVLRWGGDWNGNWKMNDQKFHDLPHFEIVEPKLA